jgi:hypothetical protein
MDRDLVWKQRGVPDQVAGYVDHPLLAPDAWPRRAMRRFA